MKILKLFIKTIYFDYLNRIFKTKPLYKTYSFIQFNNNNSFGASSNLIFNSSNNVLSLTGSFGIKGSVTPDADNTYDLGSADKRWANVYTGDLHLRNDRGNWTIVEERDFLCVVNNITGKKYKMMLQPID